MDVGPVSLIYYSLCAAPGAAVGLLVALASGSGAIRKLVITVTGLLGGIGGGALVATMPTPPAGSGTGSLVLIGLTAFTALCGWLLAILAARLLRWRRA
jgi:hypothetical protein